MKSICNINVYFKYAVRHRPSCGKPSVEQLKHAVKLNSLFLFTNIVKHGSWFINFPYYHIRAFKKRTINLSKGSEDFGLSDFI